MYIGGKKIDTKTKQVMNNKATFNERFAMKTILDYNAFEDDYEPKPVSIYNLCIQNIKYLFISMSKQYLF